MAEDVGYVAPVDHGVLSSAGSVAVGTVGGALKSIGKTALWCIGIGAAIGLLSSFGVFTAAAGAVGFSLPAGFWSGVWGTTLGALGGGVAAAFLAPLAGLVGGGKGAVQSHERVSMEKGQAHAMEMQMAAYQSMAAAENRKYAFTPAPGTAKNMAMPKIDASSLDAQGTVAGRQLALGA